MLEVRGLTKRYGKIVANDNLCFMAPAAAVTVLAGPNGAGKSTAIKAIAALLRFQGEILIDGHPNKSVEAKRLLGYVPEVPAMYEMLTVSEHLEFIARAYELDEGWKGRARELLSRFELDDKAKKLGKELSKGMQQKVSLCCALLPQPKLLLVDEPMVGLDPHGIKELKTVLQEERQRGTAILLSTHLLSSVEELWDDVLIMMEGKIGAQRSRSQVEAGSESLEELFFQITEGESREGQA